MDSGVESALQLLNETMCVAKSGVTEWAVEVCRNGGGTAYTEIDAESVHTEMGEIIPECLKLRGLVLTSHTLSATASQSAIFRKYWRKSLELSRNMFKQLCSDPQFFS